MDDALREQLLEIVGTKIEQEQPPVVQGVTGWEDMEPSPEYKAYIAQYGGEEKLRAIFKFNREFNQLKSWCHRLDREDKEKQT
jgi:hypothetical protein